MKTNTRGQAIVFLLVALTALVFVMLFNVDLHRIIQRKNQAQNAGDAAALVAARWQGSTLNLVGELNLFHVLALANGHSAAVDAITNMQARLCFTGPLTALFAAQVAAKQNRIYVDNGMTTLLREHAGIIRSQYATLFDDAQYFQEPWPGAWGQYADMLVQVASDGIAAGPDNTQFFLDPSSGHMLFEKAFYEAVLGQNWCWFYLRARGWIESYSSHRDWPAIPDPDVADYADSEIFGIGLRPFTFRISDLFTPSELESHFHNARFDTVTAAQLVLTNDVFETWYLYNPRDWTEWTRIKPGGVDDFPVTGEVRPEYDLAGADTVVRVHASVDRLTPGAGGSRISDRVVWSAAAKPFGYLDDGGSKERATSAAYFVLPAFRDVRLIPIDAASGSENNTADFEWMRHIRGHLHPYLTSGTGSLSAGCRYCSALAAWEVPEFRQEGIDWLAVYCGNCRLPSGGGRHGGGSRRGH